MYITISQFVEIGVLPQEIGAKISGGDWKTARPDPIGDGERRILLSSLPLDLQTKWARSNRISSSSPEILSLLDRTLEEEARKQNWRIPSESWLYRLWRQMPEIVKTSHRRECRVELIILLLTATPTLFW